MRPDLVITEPKETQVFSMVQTVSRINAPLDTTLIILPGRPSKGVAALEQSACGNSFEFGERRPWRNIRWLSEVMVVNQKDGRAKKQVYIRQRCMKIQT